MDFTLHTRPGSGLSDTHWDLVKDLFDCRRKRKHDLRGIVDGILHVLQSDENWRMLPASFAPWQTVYYYYDKWRKSGLWFQLVQRLPEELRHRLQDDGRPALSLVDFSLASWARFGSPSPLPSPRSQPTPPVFAHTFDWSADSAARHAGSQAA